METSDTKSQKILDTKRESDRMPDMEQNACSKVAVKIKEYRIRRADRGQTITLPAVWTDDLRLAPGDRVEVFRDTEDRLILVAKKEAIDGNPRADD